MAQKTIIYCTDGSLDKKILRKCQEILLKATEGTPIIAVSQKPQDFGDVRLCIGEIGRSWLSLFKQQDIGIAAATTPIVAFAEHDVLYSAEHFARIIMNRNQDNLHFPTSSLRRLFSHAIPVHFWSPL